MKKSAYLLLIVLLFSNCDKDNDPDPVLELQKPTDLAVEYQTILANLSWTDNSDNETGFEVHRSLDSLIGYTLLTELAENVEIYTDSSIELGTKYFYKVRTIGVDVTSEFSNIVSAGRNLTFGTVTDYEGNEYKTIQLGDQVWMAENLKSKYYADGTPLIDGTDVGDITGDSTQYYFSYNDDPSTAETYGYLYPWHGATRSAVSSNNNPSGVQGVCPTGWHLPSKAEYEELINYLGGESVAGGKMKLEGTYYWLENAGATNESGFSALPAGHRATSGYYSIGESAEFKTCTEEVFQTRIGGNYIKLNDYSTDVNIHALSKEVSYSVRCVKD